MATRRTAGTPGHHAAKRGSVGDLRLGSQSIRLYNLQPDEPDIVSPFLDSCSIISYSGASLGAVKRGIARDVLADAP
jgi:hypothetical protein